MAIAEMLLVSVRDIFEGIFIIMGKQTHKHSVSIYCYEQLYPTHNRSYLEKKKSMP